MAHKRLKQQEFVLDDDLIDDEMIRLSRLALSHGMDAASRDIISHLMAYLRWVERVHGTRAGFDLFQAAADLVIETGRDAGKAFHLTT